MLSLFDDYLKILVCVGGNLLSNVFWLLILTKGKKKERKKNYHHGKINCKLCKKKKKSSKLNK